MNHDLFWVITPAVISNSQITTYFDSNEYFYFTASVCGIRIAYGAGRAGQEKADQQ